jgi:TRAP-type C4-dicarboxylate transport system permease small subunit
MGMEELGFSSIPTYRGRHAMIAILKRLCLTVDWVVALVGKSVSYVMPLLAGVVAFEVFSRYVLGAPTIWAYDLSLFMFGYMAALGGAYAQQKRAHINVDILYVKVSRKTKCVFNIITFSLGIFFLWVFLDMSIAKFHEAIEFEYRRQSEWGPPMHHFWVALSIASVLFLAQLVRDVIAELYFLFTGKELMEERA